MSPCWLPLVINLSLSSTLPHTHTHTHTHTYMHLGCLGSTAGSPSDNTHTRQQRATPLHTHNMHTPKGLHCRTSTGVREIQSVNKMMDTAPSLPEGETELQPCSLHFIEQQACVRRLQTCQALKEDSAVFYLMNVSDQLNLHRLQLYCTQAPVLKHEGSRVKLSKCFTGAEWQSSSEE
ncbi:hypothetical protein CHARACLAT_015504 [Characodon lateralis]|uniref:Uncharacterized protein n=1 Tax=Characodon lateralis TaxID=208331 RepID=A0ABU7D715_9TELE|nr:hypothetical protein [Characodon lateralis]